MTQLQRNRVTYIVGENPKTLIEAPVDKIKPASVRDCIISELKYWSEKNRKNFKHLRKMVLKDCSRLRSIPSEI